MGGSKSKAAGPLHPPSYTLQSSLVRNFNAMRTISSLNDIPDTVLCIIIDYNPRGGSIIILGGRGYKYGVRSVTNNDEPQGCGYVYSPDDPECNNQWLPFIPPPNDQLYGAAIIRHHTLIYYTSTRANQVVPPDTIPHHMDLSSPIAMTYTPAQRYLDWLDYEKKRKHYKHEAPPRDAALQAVHGCNPPTTTTTWRTLPRETTLPNTPPWIMSDELHRTSCIFDDGEWLMCSSSKYYRYKPALGVDVIRWELLPPAYGSSNNPQHRSVTRYNPICRAITNGLLPSSFDHESPMVKLIPSDLLGRPFMFVCSGGETSFNTNETLGVELFFPSANQWVILPSGVGIPTIRQGTLTTCVTPGYVYVMGGTNKYDGYKPIMVLDRFNLATMTWEKPPLQFSLPKKNLQHYAINYVAGYGMYLMGGEYEYFTDQTAMSDETWYLPIDCDGDAAVWTLAPSLPWHYQHLVSTVFTK